MEAVFSLSGALVMPFWALMIFLPRWPWTERLARSWWIVALPAAGYLVLVAPELPVLLPLLARPTLASVAPLLGSARGATIAWLHFLAFDLFVGRAVYLDARERGVPSWLTSLILGAVLMVGPLGLLAYLFARLAWSAPASRPPSTNAAVTTTDAPS
ncbi:MAG: ABA4-like family protein [Polyangiales bacterium]